MVRRGRSRLASSSETVRTRARGACPRDQSLSPERPRPDRAAEAVNATCRSRSALRFCLGSQLGSVWPGSTPPPGLMSSPTEWPSLGTPVRSSASHSPSTQSRPASASSNWSQPGSFYLSGSSAPTVVHQYRSSRHPPPPPRPSQSPRASGSSSPGGSFAGSLTGRDKNGAAILMTEAVCCCCGSGLRYPRDSSSYRCGVCLVVGEGRAKECKHTPRGRVADKGPCW